MANDIAKCCPDKVDDGCFDKNMNCVSCIAMELYNAGYRKEDEIRKEIAKEILQKITEKDHKILAWEYGVGYMDCMQNLKSVISKYGVEVEE